MQTMDLFELYNELLATVNSQQGGHAKPQGNFTAWLHAVSMELFKSKFGEGWEKGQRVVDELGLPFLRHINAQVVPNTGLNYDFIPIPTDYAYFSSMRILIQEENNCECMLKDADIQGPDGNCQGYKDPDMEELRKLYEADSYKEIRVEKVDNDAWDAALRHKLKKPSKLKPICTQVDKGFKVAPAGVAVVVIDYLRYPKKPVFVYTLNSDDTINYNQAGSTQLDWPETVRSEFISILKQKYGSFTSQPDKYQQAESERNKVK